MFTRVSRTYWKRPVKSKALIEAGFTFLELHRTQDSPERYDLHRQKAFEGAPIATRIESFEDAVDTADDYEDYMDSSPTTGNITAIVIGLIFLFTIIIWGLKACA